MKLRKEISKALVDQGVDITITPVRIVKYTNHVEVFVDDEWYGAWDMKRHCFSGK